MKGRKGGKEFSWHLSLDRCRLAGRLEAQARSKKGAIDRDWLGG